MREFSADYLTETRRGMWRDRDALADLRLSDRSRILDVGAGTGEFARVLAAESSAPVVALDADTTLLGHTADGAAHRVAGDATRLPVRDDACDLVACQALLINLQEPAAAVEEFARVSSELVAVIEPDNSAVTVASTVAAESALSARAREFYVDGVHTDVTLGADAADVLADAGLRDVSTTRHEHVRVTEPPYDDGDLDAAARKATADRLADQRPELAAGGLADSAYDELRAAWREMGRDVVAQMQAGEYVRRETVPFYVTVGRLPDDDTA
ncbi:class I SAM-dependent methyltransferase [Halobacterium salinarum]|uniref:class I SAM-dependent methyltransferase n=1 Tax=Halobacterium salinarum TaxID=2242 RepID=UPI002553178D|nr:class I SAM-dependent methyltransferase [Halobacterium salinarum]MDL0128215.1 methyltransferase domain-containing protein [Halobacterium salinarum]